MGYRDRESGKERHRQRDRQTDRQTDRQAETKRVSYKKMNSRATEPRRLGKNRIVHCVYDGHCSTSTDVYPSTLPTFIQFCCSQIPLSAIQF